MKSALLYLYTESPLHAGTGTSVSAVDLPIQRERTTGYPNIQGSGIKGALRSALGSDDDGGAAAIFGPLTNNASDYAGALSVGEARIVLFPIRSLVGVFAYVTSADVLARLYRDYSQINPKVPPTPPAFGADEALVTSGSQVSNKNRVVLEEFTFTAKVDTTVDRIAEFLATNALPKTEEYKYFRDKLQRSLVILPDDAFRDFVLNSTEIATHVRIAPDSKTVENGALWTEESLPADCLLATMITARQVRAKDLPQSLADKTPESVLKWLTGKTDARLQIGGNETTGQGVVALRWQGE